jgi:hypothetical protein
MHMVQRLQSPLLLAALVAGLLLAGCTAPASPLAAKIQNPAPAPDQVPVSSDPGAPTGGGRVLNAPPRVASFHVSTDQADNGGSSTQVFSAVVGDDNAEQDLASLMLVGAGPQRFTFTHAISAQDLANHANPGVGSDSWAVWDALPQDGLLQLSVRVTYPYGAATGDYVWTLTVSDQSGAAATSQPISVQVLPVHVVEVQGAVDQAGKASPADGWGGWSAAPGAANVPSVTYLKVINKGTAAGQRFVVDFTSKQFVGVQDKSWRVPLDGNIRFAAWEGSANAVPRDGQFAFGDVSPDGSVTLTFTQAGSVMYVAYEVVQVPSPLPSQVYYASATVTAL